MAEEDMHRGDSSTSDAKDDTEDTADQSFRDHVAKLREKRAEKGIEDQPNSTFSSDEGVEIRSRGSSGIALAEVSDDRKGSPKGDGKQNGMRSDECIREVRQLRTELRAQTRALNRIANALEHP